MKKNGTLVVALLATFLGGKNSLAAEAGQLKVLGAWSHQSRRRCPFVDRKGAGFQQKPTKPLFSSFPFVNRAEATCSERSLGTGLCRYSIRSFTKASGSVSALTPVFISEDGFTVERLCEAIA